MGLVPQFGFLELLLIAVVALVVVGPKDLPHLMRRAGGLVAKARGMAAEFTAAFDQMAREAEMEDLRKELETLKQANPVSAIKRELDEAGRAVTDTLSEADLHHPVSKPVQTSDLSAASERSEAQDEPAPAEESRTQ